MTTDERLDWIERVLAALVDRSAAKDWYQIGEFARLVGRAPFTCREWARLGRVRAAKRNDGRGRAWWAVSHRALLWYQREGLLPAGPTG